MEAGCVFLNVCARVRVCVCVCVGQCFFRVLITFLASLNQRPNKLMWE